MRIAPDVAPPHHIVDLGHQIIDACPSGAGTASEIVMWANEIRERRPSREELTALVDAACPGLPDDQRTLLINGLRAFVRFAER